MALARSDDSLLLNLSIIAKERCLLGKDEEMDRGASGKMCGG